MARPRAIPVATAIKDDDAQAHQEPKEVSSDTSAQTKELSNEAQAKEEKALEATVERDKKILNLAFKMTEDQLNIALKDPLISNGVKEQLKERIRGMIRTDQMNDAAKVTAVAPDQPPVKPNSTKVPDPSLPQIPRARSEDAEKVEKFQTAMCLKNGTKFMAGSWRHLVRGKTISAPPFIIESLRTGGFVK